MTGVQDEVPQGLRKVMAWIHGWLGLLAGWMLFAMFLTGTASYFRPEITQWMQPEMRAAPVPPERSAADAVRYLQTLAGDAAQWAIYLPDTRTAVTRAYVQDAPPPPGSPPKKRRPEIVIDPATGVQTTARDTRGGEQFYRFHFQLQLPHPWGRWLAGLCGMFMLVAIISGVITHKRIFADFFLLRWGKGQRSWLDAHNVSAVLALPYHAMITYTGLITLAALYMPWPARTNFPTPDAYYRAMTGEPPETPATGRAVPLASVSAMVRAAEREWPGGRASRLIVRHPGDAAATVTVVRHAGDGMNARGATITYAGTDGRRLAASAPPGAGVATAGVMLGLHLGSFAGPAMRWLFFLLGLTGTAMVGTGLLLWTAKRRRPGAAPFLGLRLVERLNIAAVAALPAGMAAFLLANRLIPAGQAGRADTEVAAMFWIWGGVAVAGWLRPARRAWAETLALSAVLFAAIPVVNAITTDRGLDRTLFGDGDALFRAFDLAMLAIALLLAFGASRAGRRPVPARAPRRRIERKEPAHAG
ncbi:PepSY-associated TM helix domain-containing protein [Sphingomonas montana]|uniref:PepSY-associated TM helix domain-containing protein n=1 Tax=Sphingomonas montana TaxID=1843236 RepID=UPI00096D04F9|nr:PepSY-associated TM helix domain-containing protein [Sphingomonas montana]